MQYTRPLRYDTLGGYVCMYVCVCVRVCMCVCAEGMGSPHDRCDIEPAAETGAEQVRLDARKQISFLVGSLNTRYF